MSTPQYKAKRAKYPSDMTKHSWKKLKPLRPTSKSGTAQGGRPPVDLRVVINP